MIVGFQNIPGFISVRWIKRSSPFRQPAKVETVICIRALEINIHTHEPFVQQMFEEISSHILSYLTKPSSVGLNRKKKKTWNGTGGAF